MSPVVVFTLGTVVAVAVTLLVGWLPTVRMQVAALAVACAVMPLAAVLSTGALMLERRDAAALAVPAVLAAAAVLASALHVGGRMARHVSRLRTAPEAIAAGELSARAERGGPAEVDAVAGALNDMAARLEELLDSRTRLVMWAGHDLRTPIASLRAMTEAVEDGLATPAEYMPRIHARVRDLQGRVDDMFELARLDAGGTHLDPAAHQPGALLRDAVEARSDEAAAAGVRLGADAGDVPPVWCDATAVSRILDNLIANALRHTPEGGRVEVTAHRLDDEVAVRVTDSGEGFDPRDAERMFEAFWRADHARASDRSGAGLGLAIARGLVEAHGGVITARTGGRGAQVEFTLPRAGAQRPADGG